MAKRSRGGCLGLIGIVVLLLLLIAFLEKGHLHINLPDFGSHSNGGLHEQVHYPNSDRAMISRWISEAPS